MLRCISALNSLKYLLLPCRLADDIPEEGWKTVHQLPSSCKRTCRIKKTVIKPRTFKHFGYSSVVINRSSAPDLHAGAQEQMHAAEEFSLSAASIDVLLASAIRATQSDQWSPKAFVRVYLSQYSKLNAIVIGINLNATWLIRNWDWDGPVSQSVSQQN